MKIFTVRCAMLAAFAIATSFINVLSVDAAESDSRLLALTGEMETFEAKVRATCDSIILARKAGDIKLVALLEFYETEFTKTEILPLMEHIGATPAHTPQGAMARARALRIEYRAPS